MLQNQGESQPCACGLEVCWAKDSDFRTSTRFDVLEAGDQAAYSRQCLRKMAVPQRAPSSSDPGTRLPAALESQTLRTVVAFYLQGCWDA